MQNVFGNISLHSTQASETVNKQDRLPVEGQEVSKHSTVHFSKVPIHFRRPQEFHSFVYMYLYVVGIRKSLRPIVIETLLIDLTLLKHFFKKPLIPLSITTSLRKERV